MTCIFNGCQQTKLCARNLCHKHWRWAHKNNKLSDYNLMQRKKGTGQITRAGYKRITTPDGRRIFEHVWIVEQSLGKKLDTKEKIHHIDRNKLNNNLNNLEIISQSEHLNKHRIDLINGRNKDGLMIRNWSWFIEPTHRKTSNTNCSIMNCEKTTVSWGLCRRHATSYQRWRKLSLSDRKIKE